MDCVAKGFNWNYWTIFGSIDVLSCCRFDGTKGWLWSDTNCGLNLNYICQHRPTTCGKPEQPPNSTLIAKKFGVGSRIEYVCDEGHLLVGPSQRSCLPTGFYSEFPPVCRCKIFEWKFGIIKVRFLLESYKLDDFFGWNYYNVEAHTS